MSGHRGTVTSAANAAKAHGPDRGKGATTAAAAALLLPLLLALLLPLLLALHLDPLLLPPLLRQGLDNRETALQPQQRLPWSLSQSVIISNFLGFPTSDCTAIATWNRLEVPSPCSLSGGQLQGQLTRNTSLPVPGNQH